MAERMIHEQVPNAGQTRQGWVDVYRGLAVVAMIWVHAANTFLREEVRSESWFVEAGFFHGLVAPAFFWLAGYVRGVRTGGRRPGWIAVRRWLLVMALGYSLRFPVWPLLTGSLTATDWQELVKVDVLQTLAFSGLILVAVERWVQSLPWRVLIIVALAIAFVVGQSAAEGWRTGWLGVDAWLNRNTGSLFPLFPWVGFGLAGWLCGVGVQWGQRHVPGVWGGAVMVCLTAASGWLLPRLEGFTEPTAFFWQRLGWVLALGLGLCLATARLGSHGWVSKALSLAGRESLIMYVAHLWLIHAVPMLTLSLEQRWKSQLRLPEVVAMFIGLLSVSLALAYGQAWRKKRLTPTVTPPAPA